MFGRRLPVKSDMAKADLTPDYYIDFSPFKGADDYYAWVATNFGSDVRASCYNQIEEARSKREPVEPLQVVDNITQATREIDLSRAGIRARYAY
jgi:hypothetical protein